MDAYGSRCAFSGCATEEVLDAAHIVPYQGVDTNHVQNGILLRTDLHTLFDLGLIGVDPDTMLIIVSAQLRGSQYVRLAGAKVRYPAKLLQRPSRAALRQHGTKAGLVA